MSDIVIKVEGLSKQYRLGQIGKKTLHDDIIRGLSRLAGKGDPYLKIGEENNGATKGTSAYVWALRDINFEVKRGEVLGIIGRNGAGKSTLLKVLSKVTSPTKGLVKIKGRIASLLEVGTGFHPELSGRDNIFLNGGILGMAYKEIQKKFESIVDFAGVERYIDTPVKRYSSGMYVRLAFAVAAYLEPDILIVDEVLAVGDAEFQQKCLGKMKDVSEKEGRTVLFVSHNMGAIQSLCTKAVLLHKGRISLSGLPDDIINYYIESSANNEKYEAIHRNISEGAIINEYQFMINGKKIDSGARMMMGESLEIEIEINATKKIKDLSISFDIHNIQGEFFSHIINEDGKYRFNELNSGQNRLVKIKTAPIYYAPGHYVVDIWLGNYHSEGYYHVKNALHLFVEQSDAVNRTRPLPKNIKYYLSSTWS
jgi:lipopolysaccharide transport system ATP-binding protein